jgi:hypothetical protein
MATNRNRSHIIIPGSGVLCHRCGEPTEIREHGPVGPGATSGIIVQCSNLTVAIS